MSVDKSKNEKQKNYKFTKALLQRILEKYNYACASCGVKSDVLPLEVAHIVPISIGGELSEENLTVLCPNCHQTLDRQPREYEFINFLTELLKLHSQFSDVRQEVLLGRETRFRADLIVKSSENNVKEVLLIECKNFLAVTPTHIQNVIVQLKNYKETYGDCRMVLAIPATLREQDLLMLSQANIVAWDLRYIVKHFSQQIKLAPPSYYKMLFLAQLVSAAKVSRTQGLLISLTRCNPGKADWYVYQKLIGEILEELFTPPLGTPMPESSDKSNSNRRDFIMSNYSEKGFWAFLRTKYEADYVVIDTKNYVGKVKKSDVLQIANYLRPHGAGLFGLIISRKGGDLSGCEHTLREQWIFHRKLILVLDDEDIQAMLMAKSDGRQPENILGQKIERFRLSM